MQIIDLTPEREPDYLCCLEPWSDEMKDAGDLKPRWYARMKDLGLIVKLALDDDGQVAGMIQAWPVEHSWLDGRDCYVIGCTWVHAYEGKGVGDRRGKGLGKALLAAAEDEARQRGAKGMAAWGLWIPVWMKASWYKKHGYRNADRQGLVRLVFKPFVDGAEPPRLVPVKKKPRRVPGQVTVTAFVNGWCPGQNIAAERARTAVQSLDDPRVVYHRIDTSDRATLLEWGQSDALFIDGKRTGGGPPPAYDKLRALMAKRLRKLG